MEAADVNDVSATADMVLAEIVNIYNEHEGLVSPLPSRQFKAAGGPGAQPHDCEQVTVTFGQIYTGLPGQPTDSGVRCGSPLSAAFYVEIVRKTLPASQTARRGTTAPRSMTPEEENSLADIQMQDARLLLEAGLRIGNDFMGSVVDVGVGAESGGYQAVTGTIITGVVGPEYG